MRAPGDKEPEALVGLQQVQQYISSAIPLKKRRFPIIQPPSSPPPSPPEKPCRSEGSDSKNVQELKVADEGLSAVSVKTNTSPSAQEKPCSSEAIESKNGQESKVADEGLSAIAEKTNTASPADCDVSKISVSMVKKEANVASRTQEAKSGVSVGPKDDFMNNVDILSKGKSTDLENRNNMGPSMTNVKQEILSLPAGATPGLELSMGASSVQYSLGPDEPVLHHAFGRKDSESVGHKSDKSNPSLLSLTLSRDDAVNNVGSGGASADRSNWDLNTTMDTWESCTNVDASAHSFDVIGGFSNNGDSHSSLATETVGLSLNKGKGILDELKIGSSNTSVQQFHQTKTDCSTGLRLAMPYKELDSWRDTSALSNKSASSSADPVLNLQQPARSLNIAGFRNVKSEPVDENLKCDCSIGSSISSSNMGQLNLSSVKTELIENHSQEALLSSSISLEDTLDLGSRKSQLILKGNQEDCKSADVTTFSQSVRSVMQKQDSCVSSSALSGTVMLPQKPKESLGSGSVSHENKSVDISSHKEDEYEDGEIREPLQPSVQKDPVMEKKKSENSELERDSRNLQHSDHIAGQNVNESEIDGKTAARGNPDETPGNEKSVMTGHELHSNSLQKRSDEALEVRGDQKMLDLPENKDAEEGTGGEFSKEVSSDSATNGSHKIGPEQHDETTNDKVVEEICSEKNDSTLTEVEASLSGNDAAKDSNNIGNNRSRIINLRRPVVTSPCKTESTPNRVLASRSGKERCSDLDGGLQPRENREEVHPGAPNKFAMDRDHDQAFKNPRPRFMRGRGRASYRFGSVRDEWDCPRDIASETYNSPSDYRAVRRTHSSSMNEEFPLSRRTSFRRPSSPGDRDDSNFVGFRRGDKFRRHVSDDLVYGHKQSTYDEPNVPGMQRRGYLRIRSKSPVRSRTRSPGTWSSPRGRSPNGLSPAVYRMGRMRSPDRACFRDEMISRRRGSPDLDSRFERTHQRSANSNRSSPPGRVFPKSIRRGDALDSQEMGDGDEYTIERQRPLRSFRPSSYRSGGGDTFHFHMNDGHTRPYRFRQVGDTEFVERNKGREREFDGREREFEGHLKHDSLVVPRRIRSFDEQQDGNYRPVVPRRIRNFEEQRVWNDDEFSDVSRGKRRRF